MSDFVLLGQRIELRLALYIETPGSKHVTRVHVCVLDKSIMYAAHASSCIYRDI